MNARPAWPNVLISFMDSILLFPFGMQHVATGMILYTLYATLAEIEKANENLSQLNAQQRFVPVKGEPKPLPSLRS